MHQKAKQHRDDQKAQAAPKKAHALPAAAPEVQKAPDMPALDAAGPQLAGGQGAKIDKAQTDAAARAAQQAELARVKALPSGSPEFEKYMKPAAKSAQLPEGPGLGAGAKAQAAGQAPKAEEQAPATLGPSTEQVKAEPGGAGLGAAKIEIKSAPEVSAQAAKGLQLAGAGAPPAKAPEAKAQEPIPTLPKAAVDKEPAEKKDVAPVATSTPTAEGGGDIEAPGSAAAQAPVATPEEPVAEAKAPAAANQPRVADGALAKPAASSGLAPAPASGPLPELQKVSGDLRDIKAGVDAAADLGAEAFGATAHDAVAQAVKAPQPEEGAATDAVRAVAQISGKDPNLEKAAEEKQRSGEIERSLAAHGDVAKARPGQGEAEGGRDGAGTAGPAAEETKDADPTADVRGLLGEGRALPGDLRAKAEQSLGRGLSDVRVHTGQAARELADAHGATAFAQGSDIVLGKAEDKSQDERELVLAEEVTHVVQMDGKQAQERGATGVSKATDKSEKAARAAAEQVVKGARVGALAADQDRRALYRNDGEKAAAGPKAPSNVQMRIGGKAFTVSLPDMAAGTASKSVSLPGMDLPGLTLQRTANLRFDAATGKFLGGTTRGTILAGKTLRLDNANINIDSSGQMTSTFGGAALTVGSLIQTTINASIGPRGVSASGQVAYTNLRSPKLSEWLRSGSLAVQVSADGSVTGTGSLGVQFGTFTQGTLTANLGNEAQLSGSIVVQNTQDVPIGKATLKQGRLSGTLSGGDHVTLAGSLKLDIPLLGRGEGAVQARWDSESRKVSGSAAFNQTGDATLGKLVVSGTSVTGTVADSKLVRIDGRGKAVYDTLFEGAWNGSIDLETQKADLTIGAKLARPIVAGDVTVKGGSLTVQVAQNALKSVTGNADFLLGSFAKGTAVLEDGTKVDRINATATVSLIAPQTFGDVTVTKGSITAKVRGSEVAVVSGSTDLAYRDVAKGQLNLSASKDYKSFSGNAKATLNPGLTWGDIKVTSGGIDVDLKDNKVAKAQGHIKMKYSDFIKGSLTFDAKNDFSSINGTATAALTKAKPLVGALILKPDEAKLFDLKFKDSAFKSFKGAFAWQYEKIEGDVSVTAESTDFATITGKGRAELKGDLPLSGNVKLLAGSAFEVGIEGGDLKTFSGSVGFQYADWLKGNIGLVDSTPKSISGQASAELIKNYSPGGGPVELRTGGQIQIDFKNNTFDKIAGNAEWAYKGAGPKLEGHLALQPSPITSLTGDATAKLSADTAPIGGVKLLAGGNAQVKVVASKPESFGGELNWQASNWLGGTVTLPAGTPVAGPYVGEAKAVLLVDKTLGKVTAKKGGAITLHFDSAAGIETTTFGGEIALEYDKWLRGTLSADVGSSWDAISGTAKAELIVSKDVGPVTVKKGGNLRVKFAASNAESFGGKVVLEYDKWLAGTLDAKDGSTLEALNGKARVVVKKEKTIGEFTLLKGGDAEVVLAASALKTFGGSIDWRYQDWVKGNLTVEPSSTMESIGGEGSAQIIADRPLPGELILKKGGNATVDVKASAVKTFGGDVQVQYQDWVKGAVHIEGKSDLKTLTGKADITTIRDKPVGADVILKKSSNAKAKFDASKIKSLSGKVGFQWTEYIGGQLNLAATSNLEKISGKAQVALLKDKDLGGGVKLVKGGNAEADFTGSSIKSFSGEIALEYEKWLRGTLTASGGSTFEQLSGSAVLSVKQDKAFGPISVKSGSTLGATFAASKITEYSGNVDVAYEGWLKGNLQFKAKDLQSITGSGSLGVTSDHPLVDPVSLLSGSQLKVNFEQSKLKDFGGQAKIGVSGWGKGDIAVKDGSTPKSVTGTGLVTLGAPKAMGSVVTLTKAKIGADMESSEIKRIYGRAEAEVRDFGTGWLQINKTSTLDSFTGNAGLKLTTPKPIGSFAELSGGQMLANFEKNALKDFGGTVDIKVFGWGKGSVTVDAGSTLDRIKGSATLQLTEKKSLAGGKVLVTGGSVTAAVDGQKLTKIAGDVELELAGIAKGTVKGELDVEKENFSGRGKLEQIKEWTAGPVKLQSASLDATVTDNKLTSATGKGTVDAGKIGKGEFTVFYQDIGDKAMFSGHGVVDFQPHDRVKGKVALTLSREQKLTGEGSVNVKISDKINGEVGVALDEAGHVKLKGAVNIPGPFELFKLNPYKKDMRLLDLSFVVYTPPTVKVKVGAGLSLECGIKPLVLSNVRIGGDVDLMEPSFASMSVSGQLASSAYADLNAYVEGSVQVSAAVVAVEAGLRAAANLHLEAAVRATPTFTVNRSGLSFDMPVDAQLRAQLNLILTFFAKVKVGLDVGLFSIMSTVWHYDKSPDPIRLAEASIGAKGRVQAGAGGFSGSMQPQFTPPDLSLDSLKRALHL